MCEYFPRKIFQITVNTKIFNDPNIRNCWKNEGRTTLEIIKNGVLYEVWCDNGFSQNFHSVHETLYKAQDALRTAMKECMKIE